MIVVWRSSSRGETVMVPIASGGVPRKKTPSVSSTDTPDNRPVGIDSSTRSLQLLSSPSWISTALGFIAASSGLQSSESLVPSLSSSSSQASPRHRYPNSSGVCWQSQGNCRLRRIPSPSVSITSTSSIWPLQSLSRPSRISPRWGLSQRPAGCNPGVASAIVIIVIVTGITQRIAI